MVETKWYCITCGKMVDVINDAFHYRLIPVFDVGIEWRICEGPFTQSPPPPITDETWETTFSDEARLEPEEILGVVL